MALIVRIKVLKVLQAQQLKPLVASLGKRVNPISSYTMVGEPKCRTYCLIRCVVFYMRGKPEAMVPQRSTTIQPTGLPSLHLISVGISAVVFISVFG